MPVVCIGLLWFLTGLHGLLKEKKNVIAIFATHIMIWTAIIILLNVSGVALVTIQSFFANKDFKMYVDFYAKVDQLR